MILVGESIPAAVEHGLSKADFVLICLSKAAAERGWVDAELDVTLMQQFRERKQRILPVRLDDVVPPYLLASLAYVDVFPDEEALKQGIARLAFSIQAHEARRAGIASIPAPSVASPPPPTEAKPTEFSTRKPRRGPALLAPALGLIPALTVALLFSKVTGTEDLRPCHFKGYATEVRLAGKGWATLTERDAFSGDTVERVELDHFHLKWIEASAGAVTDERQSSGPLVFSKPDVLVPVNTTRDEYYEVRYRAGRPVQIEIEAGGASGLINGGHAEASGDITFESAREYELAGTGSRAIRLYRTLDPAIQLAGPFEGVQRLELLGARGHLSCLVGRVIPPTLVWNAGVGRISVLTLTRSGLGLEVSATRSPAYRGTRSWRFWTFCGILGLTGVVVGCWVVARFDQRKRG